MTTLEVGGRVDQTVQGKYRIQGKIEALAENCFGLGASNGLESIAPIFLNRLAGFCLVIDNFGVGKPNGAREIKYTG